MDIFEKTVDHKRSFEQFVGTLDRICEDLKPYESQVDLTNLQEIKKNFLYKTDNFFSEDRKLNIGIIGRVKAGKSSFLNSFLFGGKEVLPMAVTPKTATLTKIEYDDENSLEVEYYSQEEWNVIKKKSLQVSEEKDVVVAKEIMQMIEKNEIDPLDYINQGCSVYEFDDYNDLMRELNEYVGENGKYTPMVKNVVIYMNKEELKDISIVDTPGFNDPILSRTDKTRQFMDLCDVVFFLSKSGGFLDNDDVDLLISQLPQKGVKKLVLVGSRFDDALRDIIWNHNSMSEACSYLRNKLTDYAQRTIDNYKRTHYYINNQVVEQCQNPIFVSSMAYNMSRKRRTTFDEKEKKILADLNRNGDVTAAMLRKIANFEVLNKMLDQIIDSKDDLLKEKADSFIPNAKEEVKIELIRLKQFAEARISQLNNYDREELVEKKRSYNQKINGINTKLETIFGEWCENVEKNKAQALIMLRSNQRDNLRLSEKDGIKTHFETKKESAAKWYLPWTWGTTASEVFSYDEKYKYIDASDAIENVRNFAIDSASCIEDTLNKSFNTTLAKHQLYDTVIEFFDVSDENFTPTYYKFLVEKTLKGIEVPIIKIDVTDQVNAIATQFFGEVRGNLKCTDLKNTLAKVVNDLFEQTCNILDAKVREFKDKVETLKREFAKDLLKDFTTELQSVINQLDNKEVEIDLYYQFVDLFIKKNNWGIY